MNEAFQVKNLSVNESVSQDSLKERELKNEHFASSKSSDFEISASVSSAFSDFTNPNNIEGVPLVKSILKRHPEYGGGKAKDLILEEDVTKRDIRSVEEWIHDVGSLYDQKKIVQLHGRLFIIGLSILDQDLGRQLYTNNFLNILKEEIVEQPVYSLLTEKGRELWDVFFSLMSNDAVLSHTDYPTIIDALGRRPFAQVLANRIVRMKQENDNLHQRGAFLLHIHGSWGSGKSSLLNFIREELAKKSPQWVVVEFNAWQQQRTGPSWWSLMDTVYRISISDLRKISWWRSLNLWIWEHYWRLRVGHSIFLWLPATIFGIIGLIILFSFPNTPSLTTVAQSYDKFLNFLGTKVGAVISLIVSTLSGVQALRLHVNSLTQQMIP
jgi:hypothetical protein